MANFQSEKFARDVPIMMWPPSWLLLFIYPVLPFEFAQSSQLGIGAQVLLLCLSACLIISVLDAQSGTSRMYFGWGFIYFNYLAMPLPSVGVMIYLLGKRPAIDWSLVFPPILAISVYLAPFGCFFDQTVLLEMYISALHWALLAMNWPVILGLILL